MYACNDDFEVNADWKDISIVYGLLDINDSIHYIKINKAFLNEGSDALWIAANTDSTEYQDSLTVLLEKWLGNVHIIDQDIVLEKTLIGWKNEGVFNNPYQYVYKTPGFHTQLDPKADYRLLINNEKSGKIISSRTELVQNFQPQYPANEGSISFLMEGEIDIRWRTGKNAYFYDLTVGIYYLEWDITSPQNKDTVVLEWPIVRFKRSNNTNGNEEMKINMKGEGFHNFMARNVKPVDLAIHRKFLYMDFHITAGGKEIFYYINVNKPALGAVQKKPEYTNINNGLGIFSSRNSQVLRRVRLSNPSMEELINNPLTMNLNFQ
jgi:hypothetical protein